MRQESGMKQKDDIESTRIGVVGAGSWGTALAKLLAEKGFDIDFWVFEPEVKEQIENLEKEIETKIEELNEVKTSKKRKKKD